MKDDKRAKRIQNNQRIINKRLKLIKNDDPRYYEQIKDKPHKVLKQHPYDCGKTDCMLCHSEKVFKKKKHRDKRHSIIYDV